MMISARLIYHQVPIRVGVPKSSASPKKSNSTLNAVFDMVPPE